MFIEWLLLYENIDQILPNKLHGPIRSKIGVTCGYNGYAIYTLLAKPNGRIRSIVAKFTRFKEREYVRKQWKTLEGSNYNVYEQFPKEVVEKRRRLQTKVREHRSKGDTAWIAYDTLYVNGRPVREQGYDGDELSILSWNINGLSSEKKESSDFVNVIFENDLCFLYESWTTITSNVSIDGFVCLYFYKKFQHRNVQSASGGIVLYYKDHLSQGISIVKYQSDTLIWVKLDHTFFNFESDIYVCGAYIWGQDSPAYKVVNIDLFGTLEHDITYFQSLGSV